MRLLQLAAPATRPEPAIYTVSAPKILLNFILEQAADRCHDAASFRFL